MVLEVRQGTSFPLGHMEGRELDQIEGTWSAMEGREILTKLTEKTFC